MLERIAFVVLMTLTGAVFALLPQLLQSNSCLPGTGVGVHRSIPAEVLTGLNDLQGAPVSQEYFAGHWSVVMFGYLGCTDVCHTQAMILRQISASPDLPDDLQYAYVAMDPAQDSPQLDSYFPADSQPVQVILPGSLEHAQQIALAMGVPFARNAQPGYAGKPQGYLDHPGYLLLIDPSKTIRMVYPSYEANAVSLAGDLASITRLATSQDDGNNCI